jgi:hypothetical protein
VPSMLRVCEKQGYRSDLAFMCITRVTNVGLWHFSEVVPLAFGGCSRFQTGL